MQTELDKEVERRGLHFVRYADDCVIAVKSIASATRVMYAVTEWIEKKLGINKDLARLTAYCGDRYQWVVTKTCVVRAISKEQLNPKGLVSCLDYYNSRRHNLDLS